MAPCPRSLYHSKCIPSPSKLSGDGEIKLGTRGNCQRAYATGLLHLKLTLLEQQQVQLPSMSGKPGAN